MCMIQHYLITSKEAQARELLHVVQESTRGDRHKVCVCVCVSE